MTARFLPDYPTLTCWTEGILHDENNDVDIYFVYWSKPGKPARDMQRLAERMQQSHETWLRDAGPDPE